MPVTMLDASTGSRHSNNNQETVMSSTSIYTPYFYIIRHIQSSKLYAGSRYAVGCNPAEFMQSNGYTTSSTIINSMIELEGLDAFETLRIDTNCDGLHPYDYETLFLQTNKCAQSPDWLNEHNNTGMAFGTQRFINQMLEKYGVDNPLKIPGMQQQIKQTNLEKYGVDCPLQSETVKEQTKQTLFERYGVDNASKSPEIKQKKKDKAQLKYGVDNISKSPEIKQKKIQTYLNKYGVDNPAKIPEVQEKKRKNNLAKYGYDNQSKIPFLCIIETKKSYAKNTLSKYFPELKQFY